MPSRDSANLKSDGLGNCIITIDEHRGHHDDELPTCM